MSTIAFKKLSAKVTAIRNVCRLISNVDVHPFSDFDSEDIEPRSLDYLKPDAMLAVLALVVGKMSDELTDQVEDLAGAGEYPELLDKTRGARNVCVVLETLQVNSAGVVLPALLRLAISDAIGELSDAADRNLELLQRELAAVVGEMAEGGTTSKGGLTSSNHAAAH